MLDQASDDEPVAYALLADVKPHQERSLGATDALEEWADLFREIARVLG
jgi:hypothetical protein